MAAVVLVVAGCSKPNESAARPASKGSTTATTAEPLKFSGSANSEFCKLMNDVETASNGKEKPADAGVAFDRLFELEDQLVASAPSEVKSDISTFISGYRKIVPSLKQVGYDSSKLSPKATKTMDEPAFARASNRVVTYQQQVCRSAETTTTEPASG